MLDSRTSVFFLRRYLGVAVVAVTKDAGWRKPRHRGHHAEIDEAGQGKDPLPDEQAMCWLLPVRKERRKREDFQRLIVRAGPICVIMRAKHDTHHGARQHADRILRLRDGADRQ